MNDIGFDHEVVVDEFGRVGGVGVDAADLGGGQVDLARLFGGHEGPHGGLVGEIQLGVGAGDELLRRVALGQQLAHDGRADHAAVAGDVDSGLDGWGHDGVKGRRGPARVRGGPAGCRQRVSSDRNCEAATVYTGRSSRRTTTTNRPT
jgi:hypothetical protein